MFVVLFIFPAIIQIYILVWKPQLWGPLCFVPYKCIARNSPCPEKIALQVEEQEKETGVSLTYQWSPKEVKCSG